MPSKRGAEEEEMKRSRRGARLDHCGWTGDDHLGFNAALTQVEKSRI